MPTTTAVVLNQHGPCQLGSYRHSGALPLSRAQKGYREIVNPFDWTSTFTVLTRISEHEPDPALAA